jgi:hypothetical protein
MRATDQLIVSYCNIISQRHVASGSVTGRPYWSARLCEFDNRMLALMVDA